MIETFPFLFFSPIPFGPLRRRAIKRSNFWRKLNLSILTLFQIFASFYEDPAFDNPYRQNIDKYKYTALCVLTVQNLKDFFVRFITLSKPLTINLCFNTVRYDWSEMWFKLVWYLLHLLCFWKLSTFIVFKIQSINHLDSIW